MSDGMDLDITPSEDVINKRISEACEASLHGPAAASLEAPVSSLVDLKDKIGQAATTEALSHRIAVLWELGDPVYLSSKDNEVVGEEANARLGSYRGRIVRLVAALDRAGVVDTEAWLASCELELLEATSFISSATEFRKKEVRYYTKAVYLQRRYSLMREASEGFSKAISVLASLNHPKCNVHQVGIRMKLVIGAFHLDPHRVLDILLESLPVNNATGCYAVLGTLFENSKITHLLGWKFHDYYQSGKPTPLRLHDVTATLITCGYVDFPLLISYLKPESTEYDKIVSKMSIKLKEEIQRIERPNWEKKTVQATTANGSTPSSTARKGHFSVNRVDVRAVEASIGQEVQSKDNQVLGLAAAFLRCNPLTDKAASWANILMQHATFESLEPSIERHSVTYCSAMLNYIERVVEPLYWKLFKGSDPAFAKDPFASNTSSWNPIIESIFEERESVLMVQFLAALGHRMSQSPSTLCKVCWILAHEAKHFVKFDCSDWTFMAPPPELKPLSVEYVVAECLIPSLCCLPNCIHLAEDIYRILKFFPYTSRFLTYTNAIRCINSDDVTYAAGVMAEQAAKQIIRRVGNSEDRGNRDTVQSACQFRKLGIHAPFSVTAVLVSRAMSDDNLQEALALLMAQQMPLGFDAFGFWVVYHTINTKDAKVDHGEHSWWFKRLAKFLGRVCKEYPARVPLAWLFQVIIQELYSQELGDFHLVEEIFGEMTGFKANSLVGENQVGALAGGALLKSIVLTTPWHKDKSYSAPSRCLMEVLRVPAAGLVRSSMAKDTVRTIAEELVILFNKAVSCAPYMLESSNVKFTMEVTDRVMDTYVQFVDFLSYHLTREEYFRLLPSIHDSVNVYKCPPNWVFHAYRSLIVDIRDSERKEEGEICMDMDEGSISTPGKMTFQWMVHEVMGFKDLRDRQLWDAMTPEFFSLFWTLTLADLQFPDQQYVVAEAELEANLKVVRDRLIEISDRNRHGEDRARREERRNLEREKEFWKDRIRQLHTERDSQKRRVDHVKSFVRGVRTSLLGSVQQSKFKDLETMLVQHCFFPRIKMGMEEGQFTWEFIMFAHEIGMVNFHTIILLDRIVKEVFPMMHSMTDREGAGFRVFMGAFLKKMESWRADEKLYEAECGGRPGCAVNVVSEDKSKKLMDHCGLQRLNYKWVNRLSRILKDFLEPYLTSEENMSATNEAKESADEATHRYVLRRSGLLMLNHIGKYFPVLKGLANHLKTAAGYVKDYSKDDQLKNMANHFYNELDREFERQDRWVDLKDFGGLPKEKLNALRQRDKIDAPTQLQTQDPETDEGGPTFPAFHQTIRDPSARPQGRETERRTQRRSSPIPAPPAVREPIIMRDREANLTNRDREVPSGVRGRDRPLKELRSIPDADGSRADGAIGSESQVGRVDRPRRVRDEKIESRRRTIGPGGRTSEEDARRYGQRPRRNA